MGELYKTQHTDSEHLTEEDRFEAEKQGASVVLKKVEKKEKEKE